MMSEGRHFLAQLQRLADPDDLPALIMACAGRRVMVPLSAKSMTDRCWIALAIGQRKAGKLVDALNHRERYGVEIDVPLDGNGLIGAVHRQIARHIIEGLRAGKDTTQIAAECGISRRTVQMHRKKLAAGSVGHSFPPKGSSLKLEVARTLIEDRLKSGVKPRTVADEFGIARDRVYRIQANLLRERKI